MSWRALRVFSAVAVAALAVTAGASSRPAGGITVTVAPVMVALKNFDNYADIATISYVTAARWNPTAVSEDVFITIKDVTEGAESGARGGVGGAAPHSSNRYSDTVAVFAGHKYEFSAKWDVYNVGGTSGSGVSSKTVYVVPKKEPAPRLPDDPKGDARSRANQLAAYGSGLALGALGFAVLPGGQGVAVAIGLVAAAHVAAAFYFQRVAEDPVDLNFRSIARPKIPVVPKISPGEGLPAAAARALNDLLAVQAREIGFARAVATAFDRSQGAHVKKATDWEKKQVRASGTYAAQLAKALLAEASLWPKVKAALAGSALADVRVSYEDALAFGESLVLKGLPRDMAANLTKLGLTKTEQREVRVQLATIDPGLYDGSALSALPNATDIRNLRRLAAGLKTFAKKAAKDPLHTRPA